MRPSIAVAVVLAATACTELASEPATTAVFAGGCQDWGCTGNTPIMGPYGFIEVNELGQSAPGAGDDGLIVDGLWQGGVRYRPDVQGSRMYGFALFMPALKGNALVGSYLRLLTPTNPSQEYRLYITNVGSTPYWLPVGTTATVTTYRLKFVPPGGTYPRDARDLCNQPPAASQVGDGNTWVNHDEAILYTGDRYDMGTKEVIASTPAQSGDWFNIACAGSALAKLYLNRFAHSASTAAMQTTQAARNDLLAMYTGNVCGTGKSFTVPGVEIRWGASNGWRNLQAGVEFESVWGGGRAQCLDHFRLPQSAAEKADMINECGGSLPPACNTLTGFPADWAQHGNIQSGVP